MIASICVQLVTPTRVCVDDTDVRHWQIARMVIPGACRTVRSPPRPKPSTASPSRSAVTAGRTSDSSSSRPTPQKSGFSARNVRLPVVVVLERILGTNVFCHAVSPQRIGQGRGPRRREHALVLDRHMQLQKLLVAAPCSDITVDHPILFPVPVQRVFHVVVIAQPIAFHDVQFIRIGAPNRSIMAYLRSVLTPTASITSVSPS